MINLHDNYRKVLAVTRLKTPETVGGPGAPPVTAYATVQAGIRLKDLCAQLARNGDWLETKQGYGVHNMGMQDPLNGQDTCTFSSSSTLKQMTY